MPKKLHLYTLSTCGHCHRTKEFLNDHGVEYTSVDVDKLKGQERTDMVEEVKRHNSELSFPTIVIDDETVIVGFKQEKIEEELGL